VIKGLGYYRDGQAHPELTNGVLIDGVLDGTDVKALEQMWEQAKDGGVDSFVWLGLRDAQDDEVYLAASLFGLDHLDVEDALSQVQRPKVQIREGRVAAVLKVLGYIEETSDVETGQIAIFVGPSYVLSIRQGTPGDLSNLRSELERDVDLLKLGPITVLHGILDVVVDGYDAVVNELGIDIEQVEERVFSPDLTDDSASIYKLKRENLEVRRALDPLLPLADRLLNAADVEVPDPLLPYFRDLGDHLLRIGEASGQYDSLLSAALEASRSRQAMQQNSDTRKISAWAAIFAVPTAIAGVYGMNFDNMPELNWEYGYYVVLAIMGTACILMYRAFKNSGWL